MALGNSQWVNAPPGHANHMYVSPSFQDFEGDGCCTTFPPKQPQPVSELDPVRLRGGDKRPLKHPLEAVKASSTEKQILYSHGSYEVGRGGGRNRLYSVVECIVYCVALGVRIAEGPVRIT